MFCEIATDYECGPDFPLIISQKYFSGPKFLRIYGKMAKASPVTPVGSHSSRDAVVMETIYQHHHSTHVMEKKFSSNKFELSSCSKSYFQKLDYDNCKISINTNT